MQRSDFEKESLEVQLPQQDSDISVKLRFTYIEAIKESDSSFANIEYPVDMNIGEAVRKIDGTTIIQFSLRVATAPKVAIFAVKGEAALKGPQEKIQKATLPDKNSPPAIWKEIYQEAISTVTFLARILSIPPPPIISSM